MAVTSEAVLSDKIVHDQYDDTLESTLHRTVLNQDQSEKQFYKVSSVTELKVRETVL